MHVPVAYIQISFNLKSTDVLVLVNFQHFEKLITTNVHFLYMNL